jgi:nudix-type nucleoside diphosphatase (YffH/AdpP family)
MGRAALAVTAPAQAVFLFGVLAHPPLLAAVLGRGLAGRAAVLPGFRLGAVADHDLPALWPDPAEQAEGLLVEGLTAEDIARLSHLSGAFGHALLPRPVVTAAGTETAQVLMPDPGRHRPDGAWSQADWAARLGPVWTAAAPALMAGFGRADPVAAARRRGPILVREASRLRAQATPAPVTLRHAAGPDDVAVAARREPYAGFFSVEEYDLRFRRFDGSLSPQVTRAVFVSGDAVTVLPYDPVRDRVLLIEQFRAAPFARGDRSCWLLEAIAGRVDPGETAEEAARREAAEEAGLSLGALLHVADGYPSPGAKTEWIRSYVALCDLPDGIAGVGGVEGEAEDIRSHLVPWAEVERLVATGEVNTTPLLVTLLWLMRERPRLRAGR